MEQFILQAKKRTQRRNAGRRAGEIPAVVYGHGMPTEMLALPYNSFLHLYEKAGGSTLFDLVVDAVSRKVLVQDVQHDPVSDRILHVDFYAVQTTEKMEAKVPIHFTGEAPAVKEKGGLLVKNIHQLRVRCLPQDLVAAFTVDISGLATFGQSLYVKDLQLPPGIMVLDHPGDPIVTVMKPKSEEELAKELAEEAPQKVEEVVKVQEKGKKEEGEGEPAKAGETPQKGAPAAGGKPAAKKEEKKK